MRKSMLVLALIALLLAACAPSPEPERRAITPFPTATIGRVVYGDLLPSGVSLIGQPELSAPSTVVAIAPPATATPDFFCLSGRQRRGRAGGLAAGQCHGADRGDHALSQPRRRR
ncbi:MAG: hypothetical protein HND48_19710 [Chloroflexi bacterium]|nr:hypothetical protein [Chloroflexota bacterium]